MAIATLPNSAAELLATEEIGWLTTVRNDQLQSSPIWFLFTDEALWLRTQPQQGKLRNIADNDKVSFHLDTHHGGHVVTVEGRAEQMNAFPPAVQEAYRAKYRRAITEHLHSTEAAMEADYIVTLRIRPTRVGAGSWLSVVR